MTTQPPRAFNSRARGVARMWFRTRDGYGEERWYVLRTEGYWLVRAAQRATLAALQAVPDVVQYEHVRAARNALVSQVATGATPWGHELAIAITAVMGTRWGDDVPASEEVARAEYSNGIYGPALLAFCGTKLLADLTGSQVRRAAGSLARELGGSDIRIVEWRAPGDPREWPRVGDVPQRPASLAPTIRRAG